MTQSQSITIETRGRRHYLRGNTYAIRDALRSAGAHWDRDERAWWTGQRDVAERFSSAEAKPDSSRPSEALTADSEIQGKARYQGREYLLVWVGETRRGRACKLAYRDGSRVFWASADDVQITRTYQAREYRGQRQPGMTFGRLVELREEYAAERALPSLVGSDDAPYSQRYEASKSIRTPGREIGSASWLRTGGRRIAVVLVGYAPAQYQRSSDLEDMGHYGIESGYYGVAYSRPADAAEYAALQATAPRADGECLGGVAADSIAWGLSALCGVAS